LNLKHGFGGDGTRETGLEGADGRSSPDPRRFVGTPHLRGRMMRNHDQAKDE
jgi:hypothetical protein